MCFIWMYSVLNTISEYTYFYISKNIASYTFLLAFKIDDSLQCIRNHCLIIFFHHTTNTKPFEYFSECFSKHFLVSFLIIFIKSCFRCVLLIQKMWYYSQVELWRFVVFSLTEIQFADLMKWKRNIYLQIYDALNISSVETLKINITHLLGHRKLLAWICRWIRYLQSKSNPDFIFSPKNNLHY